MVKSQNNQAKNKVSYISVPSEIINSLSSSSLQSLLTSPKKKQVHNFSGGGSKQSFKSPRLWFLAIIFFFGLVGMLKLGFHLDPQTTYSPNPCLTTPQTRSGSVPKDASTASGSNSHTYSSIARDVDRDSEDRFVKKFLVLKQNEEDVASDFWKQPDGLGYRPCLSFSEEYKEQSVQVVKDRSRYLMIVVSGGMNQQRNQIVDAVVIARILKAALVVPILQVNVIWGDESEFSDIFDLEHFKKVLSNDVRIVSSLPSTHLMSRLVEDKITSLRVSPRWIRERYLKRFNRDGVLLLRGLDSRLTKDLPSDLQKLRCKMTFFVFWVPSFFKRSSSLVAFTALKFSPPILELGNKLAERMRTKGPYIALHLRMEKDVWVRTGCLPGLSHEYDEIVNNERKSRPELLTARSNMTYHERKLAGLCPLNAMEVTRLLKALGAPRNARIYWAGGQPFGGKEALLPLINEFSHFYNKEDLALLGELEPFTKRASLMAALDYIVSETSDVFMASHGGNMGHAIQGHRAYSGHKKYITPNKRQMLPYFLNSSLSEPEFNRIIRDLHHDSLGQPDLRTSKAGKDVTKYPIPDCMCNNDTRPHSYS